MVAIIAFISQKGGVGKSTLARALAREAARDELRVKIADLDVQQGTSVEWNKMRFTNDVSPVVAVEMFKTAEQAITNADMYDMLIIDGPARTSIATLQIAKVSRLLVQPTGPSLDDLRPAVKEFHALVKAGIPKNKLVFALNHISSVGEEQDSREYLEDTGYECLSGYLPERPAFRQAQNQGLAITEVSYAKLRRRARELMESMIGRILEND